MSKTFTKSVKDFSQYDTRWAGRPYKNKPYCMRTNGCGPTACADIIASNPKYKKITPDVTRRWMINHGYVVNGSGTVHAGIPACLKAYGFAAKQISGMSDVFKEMSKRKRRAVFLMTGTGPNGTVWTTGGHYIAIKGYKTKGSKHYFYVCDPGQRMHDGWYCYETSMRGAVYKVWTCYVPIKHSNAWKFRKKLNQIANYMIKHGFRYTHASKDCAPTWTKAKKMKVSNCAMMICYALQESGFLKPGEHFWLNGNKIVLKGGLTMEKMKKLFIIDHPHKPPKAFKRLHKGTICGYRNAAHTMAYEGRTKKGTPKWFSWPPKTVKGKRVPQPCTKKHYTNKDIDTTLYLK